MKTRHLLPLLAAAATLQLTPSLFAQAPAADAPAADAPAAAADEEADKAWNAIVTQLNTQQGPPENATAEQTAEWQAKQSQHLQKLAEEVRAFYTKYSKHQAASNGRGLEMQLLMMSARLGDEKTGEKVAKIIEERSKEPSLTEDERFNYRAAQILQTANNPEEFEAAARTLAKEFPKSPNSAQLLFVAARQVSPERAKELVAELLKHEGASEEMKLQAKALLETADSVGKPLDLKLTTIDGKEIDLAKLKGKVVLIDFWATWCGPCIQELPRMKELYAKYKDQGFEIIGISLDRDKATLEAFVKKEGLNWPQYFDDKGELAQKYNIAAIPTLWLVDKKGNLRDLSAREDTDKKVADLIAEK